MLLAELGLEHLRRFADNPLHPLDYADLPERFVGVTVTSTVWDEQGGAGEGRGGVGQVQFVAYTHSASKIGPLTFNIPVPEAI